MRLLDRSRTRLPRRVRLALDWVLTIALAAACVLVFEAEIAKPYRIPSESMEPTLHCARPVGGCEAALSDRVIACRVCYDVSSPARGQIVVFEAPSRAAAKCGESGTYVKRLVGLPGEMVHEDGAGRIWIDGRPLHEPYVRAAARERDDYHGDTWRVPADSYFFLGDNRDNSCDSRVWGAVPRSSLIGPVVATYWPPTRLTVR
jgi:signal peptidase I